MFHHMPRLCVCLLSFFILAGCRHSAQPIVSIDANALQQESSLLEDTLQPAKSVLIHPEASGILTTQNEYAIIDHSNTSDGYIMLQYTAATKQRLKAQIIGPTTTYTYNLTQGLWEVFPLSDGNGDYTIKIYENIEATRYAQILATNIQVCMEDEFAPFIRPNQYVNYENATLTIDTAAELTRDETATLSKVALIYDYIVSNISYDTQKASTVQSGYLPDLDAVLTAKSGICFDYASLMTGMLRSQGIPCKLVIGYAGTVYHAWIDVWSPETGWIGSAIFFDGTTWQRMDPTFASGSNSSSTMAFIGNGKNYTTKYIY